LKKPRSATPAKAAAVAPEAIVALAATGAPVVVVEAMIAAVPDGKPAGATSKVSPLLFIQKSKNEPHSLFQFTASFGWHERWIIK
jgi:hypothetical protein